MSTEPKPRADDPKPIATGLSADFAALAAAWQDAPPHPLHAFFEAAPDRIECDDHPGQTRLKDWALTADAHAPGDTLRVVYAPCPLCVADRIEARRQAFLREYGVPDDLLHATLDNYAVAEKWQVTALAKARGFVTARRGFLVLFGTTGTGKDHLSVAVGKAFDSRFVWTTHSGMLRALRSTYGAKNPGATEAQIAEWSDTPLLIVSELGVSGGGKDEEPLLYDVFATRYDRRLPTIINTNLDTEGEGPTIYSILGARLTSRIRGSIYALLPCKGRDYRIEKRTDYFHD